MNIQEVVVDNLIEINVSDGNRIIIQVTENYENESIIVGRVLISTSIYYRVGQYRLFNLRYHSYIRKL